MVQVRNELRSTRPSEAVIPSAEAHNECRLVLRRPNIPKEVKSSGTRASNLLSPGALFWTLLLFHVLLLHKLAYLN